MSRPKRWRVLVKKSSDTWIPILAHSAQEAESLAANVPNVIKVIKQTATSDAPVSKEVGISVPIVDGSNDVF